MGKARVKVFIASSHTANALAQRLSTSLEDQQLDLVTIVPISWWTDSPGGSILSNIEREANQCDFAVILFTNDDANVPEKNVRENCLLEAGFFAGAFNDSRRCFLLVANKVHLPSDLGGVVYIPIVQADGHDVTVEDEKAKIRAAANKIGYTINDDFAKTGNLRAVRGLKRAVMSLEELYSRETHYTKGGLLRSTGAVVFINSPAPIEMENDDFASRVVENIVEHAMQYTYVIQESKINFVGMGKGIASVFRAVKRLGADGFGSNLERVRKDLNIYFAPVYGGLEFCIHDAESTSRAQCYMRCHPPGAYKGQVFWIDWIEGYQAAEFVKLVHGIRDKREELDKRIFHNTHETQILKIVKGKARGFTPQGMELRSEIEKAIRATLVGGVKLSDVEKSDVIEACFGAEIGTDM